MVVIKAMKGGVPCAVHAYLHQGQPLFWSSSSLPDQVTEMLLRDGSGVHNQSWVLYVPRVYDLGFLLKHARQSPSPTRYLPALGSSGEFAYEPYEIRLGFLTAVLSGFALRHVVS